MGLDWVEFAEGAVVKAATAIADAGKEDHLWIEAEEAEYSADK
jgi:hypothetical protein